MSNSGENHILEIQEEDKIENLIKKLLTYVCGFFTILFLPLLFIKAIKLVEKHEEAIIKRHGEVRQNRPIQAGWCFVIPCTDSFNRVDLRALKFDIEIKDVLTKDFVSLDILISFSYQVLNSMVFVNKLPKKMSTKDRLKIAIEAAFRLVITAKDYDEIQTISQRNAVLKDLKLFLQQTTHAWGISVRKIQFIAVQISRETVDYADFNRHIEISRAASTRSGFHNEAIRIDVEHSSLPTYDSIIGETLA